MNRRTFVELGAAGVVGAGLLTPAALAAGSPADAMASPELLTILRNEREVRAIGDAYRLGHAAERTPEALRRRLAERLRLDADLNAAVRRDFSEGETVQVNGWILARTEARQCALYALQP